MNELPPEILVHIFQLAIQDAWEDGSDYTPESDVSSDDCWSDSESGSESSGPSRHEASSSDVLLCSEGTKDTDMGDDDDDTSQRSSSESEDGDFDAEWDHSPANLWESPSFTPWIISWVCPHWRNIAFSTPLLWSSVHVDFDAHLLYRPLPKIEMVRSQLALSNGVPLKIDFSIVAYDQGEQRSDIAAMLEMLIDHCEKWEDVSLRALSGAICSEILEAIHNRLPRLRRFRVLDGNYTTLQLANGSYDSVVLESFGTAPGLRILDIAASSKVGYPEDDLEFPWKNLTHLSIDVHPAHLMRILSSMVDSLQALSINLTPWPFPPNTPSVSLLQLRELELHLLSTSGTLQNTVLTHVKIPNLEVLKYCGLVQRHKTSFGLVTLRQILGQAPNVRTIKCHDNRECTPDELVELLHAAPSVQHLTIMVNFACHTSFTASSQVLIQSLLPLSSVEIYVGSQERFHLHELLSLAHDCFLAHEGAKSSWPRIVIHVRKPARYSELVEGRLTQIMNLGGQVSVCDWSGTMPDDILGN